MPRRIMADILLTHCNHLHFDRKQVRKMQPYPPLQTLIAAALLRQQGHGLSGHVPVPGTRTWREETGAPARLEDMLNATLILVPVLALVTFLVAAARTARPNRPAV